MYKKIVSAFALFSCLAAQSSYDYAYGFELNTYSGSALSRVNIPDEVYVRSLSPSLDDVAVFNKNNQPVAFSFVDVQKTEDIMHEIPVTLYFVSEKTSNSTRGDTVYTYTYFVKSADERYPSFFKLTWESAKYNWEAKADVNVQFEDDYDEESTARGVLLAELRDVSDESSLRADEIALKNYGYYSNIRGWQIVITSDTKIPKITSLKAYAKEQSVERSFAALEVQYERQADGGIVYKFPSIQPVESVHIGLSQSNLILPITIFYKNDNGKWIKLDGRIINEEADIKFSNAVLTKEFMIKTNGSFDDIPQFTAYRKRTDIVFNSANNAPFILAYGSFGAKALDLPEREFLKDIDIDDIPRIGIGKSIMLGGEKALEVKAAEEENSFVPKWAIWVALVIGVAFLVFLAYKLSRELKTDEK
ncbi:MAG: DUF3999 domain-containing protein [Campylobacteraceae bacterium]|jgi:hypothetical protein|nr:DUF3999 domain-containing protein [Campylobacteraceae bacterium]